MKKVIRMLPVMVILVLALAITSIASNGSKTVKITYSGIKIVIDGQTITPKDANGNAVEPFIMDGTVYLPVRAVGAAFGKTVAWDGTTSTVKLDSAAASASVVTLSAGSYIVGEDIGAGKYDLKAIDGYGKMTGNIAMFKNSYFSRLFYSNEADGSRTYSNMILENGDTFEIGGSLTLQFTPD